MPAPFSTEPPTLPYPHLGVCVRAQSLDADRVSLYSLGCQTVGGTGVCLGLVSELRRHGAEVEKALLDLLLTPLY